MKEKISIGILGLGTVGSGVVKVLKNHDEVEIKKIAVKDITKKRNINGLAQSMLTDNPQTVVEDSDIQVVIEVIGGIKPAFDLIKTAIKNKKHIVTANKELIAKHGAELFELAKENNVTILYEAAVAGGIPIIMPLKLSLAGNNISKIAGILNGTTNYILTKMDTEGREFEDVLKEAQNLGYAEADPSGDVKGFDAAYKIAILSSIAFDKKVDVNNVYIGGIDNITSTDISFAKEFGYKIKLVAIGQMAKDNKIDVRVHPVLVPKTHLLYGVDDVVNAVMVEGDAVGKVMFSGPGAGDLPTASSVVGDLLCIVGDLLLDNTPIPLMRCKQRNGAKHLEIDNTRNKYFIRVNAKNVPGVLGDLGTICGNNNINLYNIVQKGVLEDGSARVVLLTEAALEKDLNKAIEEMNKKESINKVQNIIRVID